MLDLLTEIYSSFEPFQPPSKEAYVDCQEVRGGWEVVRELGRKITRSKKPTCQLYSGHRGVGKSTELREILRGLACHVIYTVPIAMVYSGRATQLEDNYEKTNILPMVMVKNPDGTVNSNGLEKLREIICRRLEAIDSRLTQTMDGSVAGLDIPAVFDSSDTLNHLCIMSGGHARNLMQMIRIAVNWTDELPISAEAVQRAIAETRETYLNAIQEHQWEILADVYCKKQANNNEQFLRLLLTRCLLEYRYYDKGKLKRWYNVHPLIEEIEQFQATVAKIRQLPS
jgi:hypothetical protein